MIVAHDVTGAPDAPVVVLLASLGATRAMWDAQVGPLATRLRVVRVDTRGHGGSPPGTGPASIADLAQDVLEVLDALAIERANLCGLSLGGMVAMWLGARAPDRVDRLVLACTSAHLGPAQQWHDRAATVRAAGTCAVIADGVMDRWFTDGVRPDVRAAFHAMLSDVPPGGYAACCEAIAGHDEREHLASIVAPTLVIGGAADPATPPAHQALLAARVPDARLEILAGAAHLANVERPQAFADLVLGHCTA